MPVRVYMLRLLQCDKNSGNRCFRNCFCLKVRSSDGYGGTEKKMEEPDEYSKTSICGKET